MARCGRRTWRLQVQRMLQDPKARALVENFAGQWLQLRNLKTATPDPKLFPTFDEKLRTAMLKETELFFADACEGRPQRAGIPGCGLYFRQ